MEAHGSLKRQLAFNGLHRVISQMKAVFITARVGSAFPIGTLSENGEESVDLGPTLPLPGDPSFILSFTQLFRHKLSSGLRLKPGVLLVANIFIQSAPRGPSRYATFYHNSRRFNSLRH
jgi:hypothetical protein